MEKRVTAEKFWLLSAAARVVNLAVKMITIQIERKQTSIETIDIHRESLGEVITRFT
jgi:hypothetical protein